MTNSITTKAHITRNFENNTLDMSQSFYKKACKVGSPEYKELLSAMKENEGCSINIVRNESKRSYRSLTIERMRAYIKTQPNSEANLATLDRVIEVADAKGAKYPLTKKWFLETFPEYKESTVSEQELIGNEQKVTSIAKLSA